jgi:hypothetical protein
MTLMSSLPVSGSAPTVAEVSSAATKPVTIAGLARGSFTAKAGLPDTGASYNVLAHGHFGALGQATVTGSFSTPGFILNGEVTGTLRLATSQGILTLHIVEVPPRLSPQTVSASVINPGGPETSYRMFQFLVTGGTGKYLGETGSGTVEIRLTPGGAPAFNQSTHGTATLQFQTGAAPLIVVSR